LNLNQKSILLFHYGFYDDTNHHSLYSNPFIIEKSSFTFQKYSICKKISCIENTDLDAFYTDPNAQSIMVEFKFNQRKINRKILSMFKLISLPFDEVTNIPFIIERISSRNKWINYKNELLSHIYYRMCILHTSIYENKKLTKEEIIKIVNYTRKYYEKNQKKISSSIRLKYKFKLRENIFKLNLEYQRILNKNLKMINAEIIKIMADQFSKMKNYYLNEDE